MTLKKRAGNSSGWAVYFLLPWNMIEQRLFFYKKGIEYRLKHYYELSVTKQVQIDYTQGCPCSTENNK